MSLNASGNSNPGRLDRRVILQTATVTRDTDGGEDVSWVNLATVWASKLPVGGGRMFAAEAKHYDASLTYRIRHRTDTYAGMRLVHGDDTFEIVSVAEQGREHFLDLELRAIDQSTGAVERGDDVRLLHDGSYATLHDDSNRLLHAA